MSRLSIIIEKRRTMRIPTNRPPTTPGEILREMFLTPSGTTQSELAKHLGWTPAKVNNLISGRLGVTAETALSLADALGTSPDLWMNAQAAVDLWHASRKHQKRRRMDITARAA
jgi:antitoxin HigA-1